ncbi:hypothetical protein D3C77_686570 [compost metagenome]
MSVDNTALQIIKRQLQQIRSVMTLALQSQGIINDRLLQFCYKLQKPRFLRPDEICNFQYKLTYRKGLCWC